jgi:flagellar biosynthesis protein FlhG
MLKTLTDKNKFVKTIAIASGKGGVGKSNIAANLAVAMSKLGKKVMIVDADLGLSNIHLLFNLAPKYSIQDLLSGDKTLKEVLVEGPYGIKLLPAGSGVQELTRIDEFQRLKLLEAFDAYDDDIDVLIIDTAAGIAENVTFFCSAAQEIIVVTMPEPTAWLDAYHLIKVLNTEYQEKRFHVLVNSARCKKDADETFLTLMTVSEKYMHISLDYLGYLPYDTHVQEAVRTRKAFSALFPKIFLTQCVKEIAQNLLNREEQVKGSLQFFIGNLLSSSVNAIQNKSLNAESVVER